MDYTPFYLELKDRIRHAGSQAAVAGEVGYTKAYICQLLSGKQLPTLKVLERFGLEVVIRRKEERP